MSVAYAPHYPAVTGYGTTAATFEEMMPQLEAIAAAGSAKDLSQSDFEALHRKILDLSYKVVGDNTKDARLWKADVKIFTDRGIPNATCRTWMGYMKPKGMAFGGAAAKKGSVKIDG